MSGDWPAGGWPRATPEDAGLDPAPLAALDGEFAAGRGPLNAAGAGPYNYGSAGTR